MENNQTDSGGRVTRSLRKRLTSVDSDNSSRPGTPISTKLIPISEISASPSRSTRMTRRNSITAVVTPVKTPAKRTSTILENSETITPARRSTRRRSLTASEGEEKSQTGLKIPIFPTLDEEISQTDKKLPRVRIKIFKTSPSPKNIKSPDRNEHKENEAQNTPKGQKSSIKCKTREVEEFQDLSDVEIIVLENETKDIKNKSSNITTIVLTDEESNMSNADMVDNVNHLKIEESTARKIYLELPHINNVVEEDTKNESQFENKINDQENTESALEIAKTTIIESIEKEIDEDGDKKENEEESITSLETNSVDNVDEQNLSIPNDDKRESIHMGGDITNTVDDLKIEKNTLQENDINVSPNKIVEFEIASNNVDHLSIKDDTTPEDLSANEGDESNIDSNNVNHNNIKDCRNPEAIKRQWLPEKVEILNVSTLRSCDNNDGDILYECKALSKKVEFDSSPSSDMAVKNVYPKTPVSTKTSNSCKQIRSAQNDDSFQAKSNSLAPGNEGCKMEINDEESESQIMDTNLTPMRGLKCLQTLEIAQSSTPVSMETSKQADLMPLAEKNATELEEVLVSNDSLESNKPKSPNNKISSNDKSLSPREYKEELKWINQCVKGITANGSKLDVVTTQNGANINDSYNNRDYSMNKMLKHKKKVFFLSEGDEEERDGDENSYNEEEDGDGEKPYQEKHDFHDDEAMEVADYESGDSMNSEERREIEENVIPIDAESIGSRTTDDDQDDYAEEESEDAGSFIVSDNEVLVCWESNDEEEKMNEDLNEHKKTYKRLQRLAESSSSSDEDVEIDKNLDDKSRNSDNGNNAGHKDIAQNINTNEKLESQDKSLIIHSAEENMGEDLTVIKPMDEQFSSNSCESITEENNIISKTRENIILDSSKLSYSALRLHCSAENESEEEEDEDENNAKQINISRKEILSNLNHSDRFNKSVHNLKPEIDSSPIENIENQSIASPNTEVFQDENKVANSFDKGHSTSSSPEQNANKTCKCNKIKSESCLGEVSVTSESDADKENEHKSDCGLSVSLGHCKKPKGRKEWQRSFTIDVSVKGEELKTAVTDVTLKEPASASTSTSDGLENEKLKIEDIRYLENIRHMPLPLGNPLIRTRRQSLALPTNPNMEIGSSSSHKGGIGKKANRLGVLLSNNDFNPSQSFIDSVQLQKSEHNKQVEKRKRLSKSFCGAPESHDDSIIDIDVRQLHKRSKLMGENSMAESYESIENISSSKLFTKLSSTPHEKVNKNNSYDKNQLILRRCDEILEAANRAKLEAKRNDKKSKVKIVKKKLSKKKPILPASDETNPDDVLRRISKKIKRKEKTKTALSQAIKAADVILFKKKITHPNMDKLEAKRLAPEVLEAIGESAPMKKKCKKEEHNQEKIKKAHTTSTSAGNFMELPKSSDKKRKPTFIILPTGKVSVEPITPKKRLVQASNGMEFRESPISPHAVGFKVRQISSEENNVSMPKSILKEKECKRHHCELFKTCTLPKSQWTQSGLFIEEKISKNCQITRSDAPHKSQQTKKRLLEKEEHNVKRNFKENAMMRPSIKRATQREMLIIKEQRQVRDNY